MNNPLCSYGCGKESIKQFKNGKFCCSIDSRSCSKITENRNNKLKENWKNRPLIEIEIYKEKQRLITIEKWKDPTSKFRTKESLEKRKNIMIDIWKDPNSKINSKETKEKLRNINLNNRKNGIYSSIEYKEKLSSIHKEIWKDPNSSYNSKERTDKIREWSKNKFLDEDYIKSYQKGIKSKPNRLEKKIIELLDNIKLSNFIFTGDFTFWIKGKNPDFVDKNNKKVIEIFGDYWHSKEQTGIDETEHERNRINHFNKNGYNCLILWEHEFKNFELIKYKILEFNKGENNARTCDNCSAC